ncbi:hypothetical protein BV898_12543 [Hypsibius exemplaris]|uniref:Uncharacterized protein n=1 Tax=Hypsibius exemplaris TaxID=2072580 RepID=A0A1W0WDE2_HYPEX|nr:hypothetical protein BV898_12543 [Hypsibius exemplaris]
MVLSSHSTTSVELRLSNYGNEERFGNKFTINREGAGYPARLMVQPEDPRSVRKFTVHCRSSMVQPIFFRSDRQPSELTVSLQNGPSAIRRNGQPSGLAGGLLSTPSTFKRTQ